MIDGRLEVRVLICLLSSRGFSFILSATKFIPWKNVTHLRSSPPLTAGCCSHCSSLIFCDDEAGAGMGVRRSSSICAKLRRVQHDVSLSLHNLRTGPTCSLCDVDCVWDSRGTAIAEFCCRFEFLLYFCQRGDCSPSHMQHDSFLYSCFPSGFSEDQVTE